MKFGFHLPSFSEKMFENNGHMIYAYFPRTGVDNSLKGKDEEGRALSSFLPPPLRSQEVQGTG